MSASGPLVTLSMWVSVIGPFQQHFQCKLVNIFLPINLPYVLGARRDEFQVLITYARYKNSTHPLINTSGI